MEYKTVEYDAKEHSDVVNNLPAETILKPHNIFRHFNPKGKLIVDLGCGDGSISRMAIDKGADYVLGIDSKFEMVIRAGEMNEGYKGKIHYINDFVENCGGSGKFDIAIMSYLLNNAQSANQLEKQVKAAFSFLKDGGMAIIFNNNPFDTFGGDFTKYGFRKTIAGTDDGSEIIYNYSPLMSKRIVNYFLSPEIHEQAFKTAGFSNFRWEKLELMPKADKDFWKEYFERKELPVIGIVAEK